MVPADKTRNYYEVNPKKYEDMLRNNITVNYKKCDSDLVTTINMEAKKLSENIGIADRVEVMSHTSAF